MKFIVKWFIDDYGEANQECSSLEEAKVLKQNVIDAAQLLMVYFYKDPIIEVEE